MLKALTTIAGAAAASCAPGRGEEPEERDDELFGCIGRSDKAVAEPGSVPRLSRIEKFVVLMMENRSFDHYFGHLTIPRSLGGEGRARWDGVTPDPEGKRLDGLRGDEENVDLDGNRIRVHRAGSRALGDIDHEWTACHQQWNGGRMDGFVRAHHQDLLRLRDADPGTDANCLGTKDSAGVERCGELADPMALHTRGDTPVLHALADGYTLCDRWFASVMGPTWPNRFYLHLGTSGGRTKNRPIDGFALPSLWSVLRERCITARNYYADVPWVLGGLPGLGLGPALGMARLFDNQPLLPANGGNGFLPEWVRKALDQPTFETACREGSLPTVSILDPGFLAVGNDDHPPHDVGAGQALIAAIYRLLSSNQEQWNKTLFVVTYDEHGSFFDHVPPPTVPDERPDFRQLGFRVPSVVVGPYVKRGFVSHVTYEHVSVLSTLTRRFGLAPINERVRGASDLEDCIDPDALQGAPHEPILLPRVRVSARRALESVLRGRGQSELAEDVLGQPVSADAKTRFTDSYLEALERLGVAEVTW